MYPFKKKEDRVLSEKEAAKLYRLRQAEKPVRDANSILKAFHASAKTRDRLVLLREMTEVVIGMGRWKSRELSDVRNNFNRVKNTVCPLDEDTKCWVCGAQATVRHHVILLKNGGPPTAKKNIVPLCDPCHVCIHPWLVPFESVEKGRRRIAFVKDFLHVFEDIACGIVNQEEAERAAIRIISSLFTIS